jgi:hypothetical protein
VTEFRILKKYLYPTLGARPLETIKRSEIIKLLDRIADDHGPVMADHALAMLRRVMSWHAVRDDDFKSPIIKGRARIPSRSPPAAALSTMTNCAESGGPRRRLPRPTPDCCSSS